MDKKNININMHIYANSLRNYKEYTCVLNNTFFYKKIPSYV